MADQFTRASMPVVLDIAEGGKVSKADKRRYYQQQVPLSQHPRPPGTGTGTGTGTGESESAAFRDTP